MMVGDGKTFPKVQPTNRQLNSYQRRETSVLRETQPLVTPLQASSTASIDVRIRTENEEELR